MSNGRLRLAREALARDQAEVAEASDITRETLETYESGAEIAAEDLWSLSQTLNFEASFLEDSDPVVPLRPMSPRFSSLDVEQQRILMAQGRIWLDKYNLLEALQEAPLSAWSPPDGFPRHCETGLEAAQAAEELRASWNLGGAPIRNVTYLLEDHGLKVGLVSIPGDFDSCAFVAEDANMTPLILIQEGLEDGRHRYELSSQMAHFLLDRATPQIAGHFAGGFLIPGEALHYDLGHKRTRLNPLEVQFLTIKHGVSWRTLLARAAVLRIVPKDHYDEWMEAMQDDDALGAEQADPSKIPMRMFELALRLEAEGVIDEDQRASILNLPWLTYE